MAGETERQPTKVSMAELEQEFGLEGNTSAAESDDITAVAKGEKSVEELDPAKETVDLTTAAMKEVAKIVSEEEAFRGLDDNIAIMDKREELDAEAAKEEAGADLEGGKGAGSEPAGVGEDEGGAAGAEEEAAGEGEGEGEGAGEGADAGADDDAGGAGEAGGDQGVSPALTWLREQVQDAEVREDLLGALLEEDVPLEYTAGGKKVKEPLREIIRKAAGYAGQEEVSTRSATAKKLAADAEARMAEAEAVAGQAQEMVESFKTKVDDPAWMGQFVTQTATPEYMRALRDALDAKLEQAESDPQGFAMERRMGRIESMIERILDGGGEGRQPGTGREAPGREEPDPASAADPSNLPDDLGFARGEGYPASTAKLAKRIVLTYLDGASASDVGVTYQGVVEAWVKEGKQRPIDEVAKGLVAAGRRQSQKRSLNGSPPIPATPGKGQRVGGSRKPAGDSSSASKPVPWDQLESLVAKELAAAQQGGELQS